MSELCAELFCDVNAARSESGGVICERVRLDSTAARRTRRPEGEYITLTSKGFAADRAAGAELLRLLTDELRKFLPKEGAILVAGLGNREIEADALGPKTVGKVRPVPRVRLCETGVPGRTGIESFRFVRYLCDGLKPKAVIAVDSLTARDEARLCRTFQISDAGIVPGSAGGGAQELSRVTLGIPVISVGLSTVLQLFDPPQLLAPAAASHYVDAAAGLIAGAISAALLS